MGVSRDTPVRVCGVTNAVMRAILPLCRHWRGHPRRRRLSSVILVLASSVLGPRRPQSSIIVIVVGCRQPSLRPRCRRWHHWNRTAHWPSPGMTTSSCVIHVGHPHVALVVGQRGCCCADTPLVSVGGRSRKRPRTCAGWWAHDQPG